MRSLIVLILFAFSNILVSQELNCRLSVVAQLTGNDNNIIFKTMERQLNEFINNTKWTDENFGPKERIDCNMVITINSYESSRFSAGLLVSASRPVFNSSYNSPIYNFNDKSFNFEYLEFQNLVYNEQQFESNLISVLAFHVYMILATDADSFSRNGGSKYYKQAQVIANYSQQLNGQGWKLEDGLQSRFRLITDINSSTFKEYRIALYEYHRLGLDIMSDNPQKTKIEILNVIEQLKLLHNRRPNSFVMRVFFDAKADELADILSGGPQVDTATALNTLNRIAPMHSQKWRSVK